MAGVLLTIEKNADNSVTVTVGSTTVAGNKIILGYNEQAPAAITQELVDAAQRALARIVSTYASGAQPNTLEASTALNGQSFKV